MTAEEISSLLRPKPVPVERNFDGGVGMKSPIGETAPSVLLDRITASGVSGAAIFQNAHVQYISIDSKDLNYSILNSTKNSESIVVGIYHYRGVTQGTTPWQRRKSELRRELDVPSVNRVAATSKKTVSLRTFKGRVEEVSEKTASVSILPEGETEPVIAECDIEVIHANGLSAGDGFSCEVVREGGEVKVRFKKMEQQIDKSEMLRIMERNKGLWK